MEKFILQFLFLFFHVSPLEVERRSLYSTQKPLYAQFETAEHSYLGDHVILQYPDRRINGRDFNYKVGTHSLSYGLIVALAGDYFGNWKFRGCPPQISDGYDQDPNSSVQLFRQIAEAMWEQQAKKILDCIIPPLEEMSGRICKAVYSGQDPVQFYRNVSEEYDNRFGFCTHTGYLQLSLCNWDHFGQDAVNAYKAGHEAAITLSAQASVNGNVSALQRAYFLEAYAQHFLTDLFSAGHLRTPRRLLHQSIESLNNLWPADKVNREMHDEDSASGLWVTNQMGEGWAVYGDKELSSAKSYRNFDQAVAAAQLGADEVWQAFQDGLKRSVDTYGALKKIPDLTRLENIQNFAPLFAPSNKSGEMLQGRTNLSSRSSSSFTGYTQSELNQTRWENILDAIKTSGPKASPFPATIDGLLPEVKLEQYRTINSTHVLVNGYGPLSSQNPQNRSLNFCHTKPEAGMHRTSWNMLFQEYITLRGVPATIEWDYLSSFEDKLVVLLGTDREKKSNLCVGIKGTTVLWMFELEGIDPGTSSRAVHFGRFSTSSNILGMVLQRKKASSTEAQLYTFDDGLHNQPRARKPSWIMPRSISAFAYKRETKSFLETYVSTDYNRSSLSLQWTVKSWTSGYATRKDFTVIEPCISDPPQVTLVDGNRILRAFYEPSSNSTTFKIETLRIQFCNIEDTPRLRVLSSQVFPITWNPLSRYTAFSVAESTAHHNSSLVVLIEDPVTAALSTLVFPQGPANGFLPPTVSLVRVPIGVPTVTAPFLKSLHVQRVPYTHRQTGARTAGTLFQLFDNFGILGSRLLAPDVGQRSFAYRVVGQVPALVGQTSNAIGWVFKQV